MSCCASNVQMSGVMPTDHMIHERWSPRIDDRDQTRVEKIKNKKIQWLGKSLQI